MSSWKWMMTSNLERPCERCCYCTVVQTDPSVRYIRLLLGKIATKSDGTGAPSLRSRMPHHPQIERAVAHGGTFLELLRDLV